MQSNPIAHENGSDSIFTTPISINNIPIKILKRTFGASEINTELESGLSYTEAVSKIDFWKNKFITEWSNISEIKNISYSNFEMNTSETEYMKNNINGYNTNSPQFRVKSETLCRLSNYSPTDLFIISVQKSKNSGYCILMESW
jgi:hypothetical protein